MPEMTLTNERPSMNLYDDHINLLYHKPRQLILSLLFSLVMTCISVEGFSQEITTLSSGTNTSIRGLSVVDNSVAWVSGSNGYVGTTKNRGVTWQWKQLSGYEKFDFRDIEAFSATEAIVVSAGSPAVILLTSDGGKSWKEVYRNDAPEIFLDGMDFWNRKRGIIYGDPILGKMQLLETIDGGNTWKDISSQLTIPLIEGEASFAASGTAIRTGKKGNVWIATGGKQSRLFHSKDYGKAWQAFACPITQGQASTGPFSIAFSNKKTGVAAGGDYLKDTLRSDNLVLTNDGGRNWFKPSVAPFGYRSAIEYISKKTLIATGTSGTDLSEDGGVTWRNISSEGYNCIRRSKKGDWILIAGAKGRVSEIVFTKR